MQESVEERQKSKQMNLTYNGYNAVLSQSV